MADAVNVFPPGFRIVDTQGIPISGATIEVYSAGTTDAKAVYSDRDLSTTLGNIVATDAYGYPVASVGSTTKVLVYTDASPYKIILKDADGVTLATHDNVIGAVVSGEGSGTEGITEAEADFRYLRNPVALTAGSNLDDTDILGYWVNSASRNGAITWANLKADLISELRTAGVIFSAGARVLFQQTPPTGWTLESGAAYNDATLKFTTTTPTTGGSVAFSTLFASQTLTGTVGNDTPSIAKTAAHNHTANNVMQVNSGSSNASGAFQFTGTQVNRDTDNTGSGTAHNHGLTMNAFNMAVKFATVNIGVKS